MSSTITISILFITVVLSIHFSSWLVSCSKLIWDRQIVLITGGGSGIGRLLAETLAMRNITTVVLSKDPVTIDPDNGKSSRV